MNSAYEKGELCVGDYVVFQAASQHECLSVEWLGITCYPVLHSFQGKSASQKAEPFTERRIFAILDGSGQDTKVLSYGQTVRLQNVYSCLYLSSREANGELEAVLEHQRDTKDLVDETGVRRDLWKLLPRHKLRDDGEKIRRNDQMFIVNVACGLYLNLSPVNTFRLDAWCKVNNEVMERRSLETPTRMIAGFQGTDTRGAAWAVIGYESRQDIKNTVRCLDTVVIFHKEAESFLCVSDVSSQGVGSVFFDKSKVDKSTYNVLDLDYATTSLFAIEAEDSNKGGGAKYTKKKYRLKHVATDTYLALSIIEGDLGKRTISVVTTASPDDPHTLVLFQPLDSDNTDVCLTRTGFSRIQFAASELYLHANTQADTEEPVSFVNAEAVSKGYFEDVLAVRVVKSNVRSDLLTIATPRLVLTQFIKHWSQRRIHRQLHEDWRGRKRVVEVDPDVAALERLLTKEAAAFIKTIIRALSNMSYGEKGDLLNDVLPTPAYEAQKMLFENNIHKLLFEALRVPLEQGGLSLDKVGDDMLAIYRAGFRLVEQMIKGAKDLAVKLSPFIPFLEVQLKYELNIASALMQIVVDNRLILGSLHQRQLESFCFLIPQYGRAPTYLKLLSACCVCDNEAMKANQISIGQCLSGITEATQEVRPCSVAGLRVFYTITLHALDGLHIKPYTTFPPSTDRKVRRFLMKYESDRRAREKGLLHSDHDISSSESSLSSADSQEDMAAGYYEDDAESSFEEEVRIESGLGNTDVLMSPSAITFLYRTKRSSKQSWNTYVNEKTALRQTAVSGCWVWRCEVPAVAPQWRRQWFTLTNGYLTFRKEKGGNVLRSLPVVEISEVYKDHVAEARPPAAVRNYGFVCELTSRSGKARKLLLCLECVGERNELLEVLRSEVRNAEAAIEGTKALSGDPVFAGRMGAQGKKTASLQSHMKTLLRKHHNYKGLEESRMNDKVTRVSVGTRFDTQWESVTNFIKHRPTQAVTYLEAQLMLYSKLCTGNNELTVRWVQGFMSRDIIKEGLTLSCEHPLTPGIRAAFAELAVTVYLAPALGTSDEQSQRHLTFLSQLKAAVDEHLRRPVKQKKSDEYSLNEHRFTAAILRLCNELISVKSYSHVELTSLLPPLLKVLSRNPPQQAQVTAKELSMYGTQNGPSISLVARTEPVSDLQMRIMETKLEACKVLHRLFDDRDTAQILTDVFGSFVSKGSVDQLTQALLATVLHNGHDLLFLTSLQLLFRNLSSEHTLKYSDESYVRFATILRKHMQDGQLDVILALFKLLEGNFANTVKGLRETMLAVMTTLTRMIYLDKDPTKMAKIQTDLDKLGIAPLVAVLIESRDETIVRHSLDLMIALMHGGNAEVQHSLSNYFLSRNDEALFVTLKNRLAGAVLQIKEMKNTGAHPRTFEDNNLQHVLEVLRVLQLFSEGHNLDMQDYLRTQSDNVVSYNLVQESLTFLCVALTIERHTNFTQQILVQAFNTLTEYCQGPCKGNQVQLVKGNLASHITGALGRRFDGLTKEQVNEIRTASLLCLHSVLEGNTLHDPTTLAVQHMIDANVLRSVVESSWEDRKDESSLEVAFNVFILLKMLKMVHELETVPGYAFLDTMTGGIEISREGRLERVYFRIPPISANLSDETKDDLLRSVNRSTSTARISDFYYRAEGLIFEIEYYQKMFYEQRDTPFAEYSRIAQQLLHRWSVLWHDLMLGLAFTANILLVCFANYVPEEGTHVVSLPGEVNIALRVISVLQVAVSTCLVTDFLIAKAPLISFRQKKQQRLEAVRKASQRLSSTEMIAWWNSPEAQHPLAVPPSNNDGLSKDDVAKRPEISHGSEIAKVLEDQDFTVWSMLWSFKGDTTFLFYILCLMCAVLSMFGSVFFLSIHLLAVSGRSPVLLNVITAVTRHSRALVLTALLGAVVVYLFTVMAFILFREKFQPEIEGSDDRVCDTFAGCFRFLLMNAVRAGGGVGDLIEDHSWNDRPYIVFGLLSDFLFFVIIIVILLNIISGVIIDTFARLREERQVVEDDIKSRCFICGIESTQFDRQGEGFEHHIKHDHNLWLYIYFLHHLMKKDVSDFTGQESYVYNMIQKHDLGFFPLNKAIVLEGKREEEDRLIIMGNEDRVMQDRLDEVESRIHEVHQVWSKAHQEHKDKVSLLCEQAVQAVEETHKTTPEPTQTSPSVRRKRGLSTFSRSSRR
eukprot:TRINITY_DN7233_c0_g1_i1.p1 TRINITY_DN7233_c0_g1~~TRINITY_DN7233_c0_g1_i1.p1  ORF type:complete len:2182 (+),score=683.60 TRINITY_DN7233_c0_g1_i1:2399-8944(+)